jgi:hypothetical protein
MRGAAIAQWPLTVGVRLERIDHPCRLAPPGPQSVELFGAVFPEMPRFYFDVTDTGRTYSDPEGTELPGLEEARAEALVTLGGIARDELPDGDVRDFVIRVRTEEGPVLLTASLLLRVERVS